MFDVGSVRGSRALRSSVSIVEGYIDRSIG